MLNSVGHGTSGQSVIQKESGGGIRLASSTGTRASDNRPGIRLLEPVPVKERTAGLSKGLLVTGALTGLTGNILFTDVSGLGLNVFLFTTAFFAGWFWLAGVMQVPLWRKLCGVASLAYASALGFRASEILMTVNFVLLVFFVAMACVPSVERTIKSLYLMIIGLFQVAINVPLGALLLTKELPWSEIRPQRHCSSVGWRVGKGLLIAFPFLVVFGSLFASADLRFNDLFQIAFVQLLASIFDGFWVTVFVLVGSLGLLRSSFLSRPVATEQAVGRVTAVGFVETITVLVLLNGLFAIFVVLQLPYLFGGQQAVSETEDLVWSAYARRGFFELAGVVALVIPTVMTFQERASIDTAGRRRLLTGLCLLLSGFTGVIVASAFHRMVWYTETFGLSELRIYVCVFIIMLAVYLVLLNILFIMHRSQWFVPVALGVGVLFSLGIQVPNIQGLVAADIINRHLGDREGDLRYLGTLSADTVPVILSSKLPQEAQRRVLRSILRNNGLSSHRENEKTGRWLESRWSELHALELARDRSY